MAHYTHDIGGYETWDGVHVELDEPVGSLDDLHVDPEDLHSVLVFAHDEHNAEDNHWFWAHTLNPYEDWDGWDHLIEDLMDGYGMGEA